mmetsp:Transcript_1405/g.3222  ORF Transcript_1405/g.3222 Transcript_1405/m.3222 type:complete len:262 (-) Transcript_1405:96-881(-)|eukprot:CAMPEP_0114510862 /NCGR_PEP_ID=MMETSP0109-20121206/14036_1 /TAXON_ID=29199 /ORGANISM="Chlorarachnion reptans, Strain CCCM449" /LENGTH=261 /DNA_ID=CAMNT_0001690243 /DNA_START=51 /DNA_END=836 /DNA_ORIENTATION=-
MDASPGAGEREQLEDQIKKSEANVKNYVQNELFGGLAGPREQVIARVWESKLNSLHREYFECINARQAAKQEADQKQNIVAENTNETGNGDVNKSSTEESSGMNGRNTSCIDGQSPALASLSDRPKPGRSNPDDDDTNNSYDMLSTDDRPEGYTSLSVGTYEPLEDTDKEIGEKGEDRGKSDEECQTDVKESKIETQTDSKEEATIDTRQLKGAKDEIIDAKKAEQIQRIMGELDLPAPDWAKNVPEEVWMKTLGEKVKGI